MSTTSSPDLKDIAARIAAEAPRLTQGRVEQLRQIIR